MADSLALPDEQERAPDSLRRWYRDRMIACHDLLHVLTGYDRDGAGEVQLVAFSLGVAPMRVLRVGLVLALFGVPLRTLPGFARDLWRAWRRGSAARISPATRWEDLLPLPSDQVRARLGVAPLRDMHPKGVWREEAESGRWLRIPVLMLKTACVPTFAAVIASERYRHQLVSPGFSGDPLRCAVGADLLQRSTVAKASRYRNSSLSCW